MIFNQQGLLDIDEMIAAEPTFQRVIADGIVTDDELHSQSELVIAMLHEVERRFGDEDQQFIKRLFAETNVLTAMYRFYELNNLK